jgi:hypothetical protein
MAYFSHGRADRLSHFKGLDLFYMRVLSALGHLFADEPADVAKKQQRNGDNGDDEHPGLKDLRMHFSLP